MKYLKHFENINFDEWDEEEHELNKDTVSDELKNKGIVEINTSCGIWELLYEEFAGLFGIRSKDNNNVFIYATPYWDDYGDGIPVDFYRYEENDDPIISDIIRLGGKIINLEEYISIMKNWIENNICD